MSEATHTVEAICIGQRITTAGKLSWFFLTDDDREIGLGSLKGHWVIGANYVLTRTEKDATYTSGPNQPYLSPIASQASEEQISVWRVLHEAFTAEFEAKRMGDRQSRVAKEANVETFDRLTVAQLRRQYIRLKTHDSKAMFMANVMSKIQGW